MSRTITHFMWGFQPNFRHGVEQSAKSALQGIGVGVDPIALLIGFRASPAAQFDWCVEPENEPIGLVDLSGVQARGNEIFKADDESKIRASDPLLHVARQNALRNRSAAKALCETLDASPEGDGRRHFAAPAVRVGNYDVHTVIGVIASRWAQLPTLQTRHRDRYSMILLRSEPAAPIRWQRSVCEDTGVISN